MKNSVGSKSKHDFSTQKIKTGLFAKNKLLVRRGSGLINLLPFISSKIPLAILNRRRLKTNPYFCPLQADEYEMYQGSPPIIKNLLF